MGNIDEVYSRKALSALNQIPTFSLNEYIKYEVVLDFYCGMPIQDCSNEDHWAQVVLFFGDPNKFQNSARINIFQLATLVEPKDNFQSAHGVFNSEVISIIQREQRGKD